MDYYGSGIKGEVLAKKYLLSKGYEIIDENVGYKNVGEIDLVAKDSNELVFVEVKYRKNSNYGHPLETITKRKIDKIINASRYYLREKYISFSGIRYDVVVILGDKIEHIENAFCSRW